MNFNREKVWITWSDHRRSRVLARQFEAEYLVLDSSLSRPLRYIFLTVRTINALIYMKPKLLICQNPSIILAALLSFVKPLFSYKLIVDRHSNFKFDTEGSKKLKWRLFHFISEYSIKKADITIITNNKLAEIVESKGGKGVVLPDKIPDLELPVYPLQLPEKFNFLFICTFSEDEPITEVLESFRILGNDYGLYITGNFNRFSEKMAYQGLDNVHFLGFLSEKDYIRYLFACDATITLTSAPMTLNCGSYEAVSAKKPQIVSGSEVIEDYFSKGAYYIRTFDPLEICEGAKFICNNLKELKEQTENLNKELSERWEYEFEKVNKIICDQISFKNA